MKRLAVLISSESIAPVQELLEARHISDFTFSNVIAKRAFRGRRRVYRGLAYEMEFDEEVKLEAVVQDDRATDIAYAVLKAARDLEAVASREFSLPQLIKSYSRQTTSALILTRQLQAQNTRSRPLYQQAAGSEVPPKSGSKNNPRSAH